MKFFATLTTLAVLSAAAHAAAPPAPLLEQTDELGGELRPTPWLGFVDSYYGYMTDIPIKLKAGDGVSFVGKVTGDGRKVALALLDPSGKMIAATARDRDVGVTKLDVEAVGATGRYQLRVVSDRVGRFTVTATAPGVGDNALTPGVPQKDELKGKLRQTPWHAWGYHAQYPVALKAGEPVTVTGKVTGKGRRVVVGLLDRTGKVVALSNPGGGDVTSTRLEVDAVSATGTYQVVIASDQIGRYEVVADFPGGEDVEGDLAAKADRLEKELAEVKAKLAAIREKNQKGSGGSKP